MTTDAVKLAFAVKPDGKMSALRKPVFVKAVGLAKPASEKSGALELPALERSAFGRLVFATVVCCAVLSEYP